MLIQLEANTLPANQAYKPIISIHANKAPMIYVKAHLCVILSEAKNLGTPFCTMVGHRFFASLRMTCLDMSASLEN
jgi:hypothetical protein